MQHHLLSYLGDILVPSPDDIVLFKLFDVELAL